MRWEGLRDAPSTVVGVEFLVDGDGTLVSLHHTRFAGEGGRDMHAGCLDNRARRGPAG